MKCFPFGLPQAYIEEKKTSPSLISEKKKTQNIPIGHLIRNDILGTHGVLCRYLPELSNRAELKDPLKIMLFHKTYK